MNQLDSVIDQLKDKIAKTAVTNSVYTFSPATRSIFNPENLDPIVKLLVPTATPIRTAMPRSKGYGQAANWKQLTSQLSPRTTISGTTVNGTGASGFFADAGTPNATTQTFVVRTAPYKNIGRDVEVGRQAIASSRGYQDIRDELIRIKTLETMLAEEDAILNGAIANDPMEFDGLAAGITTNTTSSISALTVSGIGASVLASYWGYGAVADTLIINPFQQTILANDLQQSGSIQRIVIDNQGNATGGVRLAQIVHPITGTLIDVIASRYAGTVGYLLQLRSEAGESYIEMEDLEGLSVYEPPVATHSVISRVYETTVLKLIGEVKQFKFTGLSVS